MAKLPLCLCALLALAAVIAGPALAEKGGEKKKAKEVEIKALEEQIHQLREQEKAALKGLDEHYDLIIRSIEPKEVHGQLASILVVLQNVHQIISIGDFDYGGNRHAAQESVKHAEQHVEAALKHDTPDERHDTAESLQHAFVDVEKALTFSIEKYGTGAGKDKGEPESRAAANAQLAAELPKIKLAYQILSAVDHEIKDFKEERHILREKRDAEKHELKEQIGAKVKGLEEEIKALKK
jgi:hypothetical protein